MAYYIADGEPLKKAFNVAEIFSMCLGGFYMYSINLETYNPSLHVKQWNIIYIYIYIYIYVCIWRHVSLLPPTFITNNFVGSLLTFIFLAFANVII